MNQVVIFAVLASVLFSSLIEVSGHGMMLDPVGRSSRWRKGSGPVNYDDNGIYCGGYWQLWGVNGGKCGVCGDDYSLPTPRPNELGGRYGQGVIVKSYRSGETIPVEIRITANHLGYFYFNLCNLDEEQRESEQCFQKYRLKLVTGGDKYQIGSRTGLYNLVLSIPKGLKCKHCILRWTYNAGNNWGSCPNGGGALGCGPQENFKNCADIKIE